MTYEMYKFFHIVALFCVFGSLLGCLVLNQNSENDQKKIRSFGMLHGIGLLFLLVSGFGMLARLGIHDFPFWISGKLFLWLALGGLIAFIKRKGRDFFWGVFFCLIFLIGSGVYLAIFKP